MSAGHHARAAGFALRFEACPAAAPLATLYLAYLQELEQRLNLAPRAHPASAHAELTAFSQRAGSEAYGFEVNGVTAGFALIRPYPPEPRRNDVEQFYVVPAFRRLGLGATAASRIMRERPGPWLVRVLPDNPAALIFWERALSRMTVEPVTRTLECDVDLDMVFLRCTVATRDASADDRRQ